MYTLNYNSITVLLHQGLKDLSIIFSSIQLLTILGHQYDSDLTELHDHDVIVNNWLIWFMCEDQKLSKLWNKSLCHLIHVCQGRIKYINNYCTWLSLTWHDRRQACVSTNVPNKCRRKRLPSKSLQYHRTSYSSDGDNAPTSRYCKTPMSEYCDLTALL